jgi:hypothetical protein
MKPEGRAAFLAGAGALVGGWIGHAVAKSDGMAETGIVTTIGAALGASLGAAIATHGSQDAQRLGMSPAASHAANVLALQQTSGGQNILVVDPSVTSQTVSLAVGTPVVVYIPKGFTWVSVDGSPIADTTSPYEFTFQGAITHTFVWIDSLNQQHQTVFSFVVAPTPSTQSTTA